MASVKISVDPLKTTVESNPSVMVKLMKKLLQRSPSWLKSNWRRIVGVVLSCVILVVWSLFAVPTVFYRKVTIFLRY